MTKPWLDIWEYDSDSGNVFVETPGEERSLALTAYTDADGRLAAAAPVLVRALLEAAEEIGHPVRFLEEALAAVGIDDSYAALAEVRAAGLPR